MTIRYYVHITWLFCSLFASSIQANDIFHAIKTKNLKAIHVWIKSKPDVTTSNAQGQSVLHEAVLSGSSIIVQKILSLKGDINVLNADHKTALDLAVEHDHVKIVWKLIKKGAMVTRQNNLDYVSYLYQQYSKKIMKAFFIMGSILLLTSPLWIIIPACMFTLLTNVPIIWPIGSLVMCTAFVYTCTMPFWALEVRQAGSTLNDRLMVLV